MQCQPSNFDPKTQVKKKSGVVTCDSNPSARGVELGRSLHLGGQPASSTH